MGLIQHPRKSTKVPPEKGPVQQETRVDFGQFFFELEKIDMEVLGIVVGRKHVNIHTRMYGVNGKRRICC